MESVDQLFSNRVGVANISKVEGNHQRDEDELEKVQFFHSCLGFMHLNNHGDKVRKLVGHFKKM